MRNAETLTKNMGYQPSLCDPTLVHGPALWQLQILMSSIYEAGPFLWWAMSQYAAAAAAGGKEHKDAKCESTSSKLTAGPLRL